MGVVATAAVGIALTTAPPHGGEPFAVAAIAPPASPTADDPKAASSIPRPAPEIGATENGVTVVRTAKIADRPPGPLVIKVPQALGQSEVLPVDKRLIEQTRYGPLPKIAADGTRARDFYARPLVFAGPIKPGTPRVALVIGGLGSNIGPATDAVIGTSAAVSLALSPHGANLDNLVMRAKAAGHEVLLRLPIEDETHAAPGPHTLANAASAAETLDNLHWLMSRASGYVGVVSGSEVFEADKAAATTTLAEIDQRGLLYVNGGPSKGIGAAGDLRTGRADLVLDVQADALALRAYLVKLESVARARGFALGVITERPADFGALAQFVDSLESKGMVLVPASALANTSAQPVAAIP